MSIKRKRHRAQVTFQVALEAAKGTKTVNQLTSVYNLHPTQISQWKRQLLDGGPAIVRTAHINQQQHQLSREATLFEQIGRRCAPRAHQQAGGRDRASVGTAVPSP